MSVMLSKMTLALWRMRQRQSPYSEEEDYDAVRYAPVSPTGTAVTRKAAQSYYVENVETGDETDGEDRE